MAIRFNASQNDFPVYDAGTYDFRVEAADQGTSKNGNPQLKVKLTILGGKYDGKTHMEWYSLTPQSMWKLTSLIEATGCPHVVVGEDAKKQPIIEFEESDLVGLIFRGDITIEEYQGKSRNRLGNESVSPEAGTVSHGDTDIGNDDGGDALDEAEAAPAPAPAPAAAPKAQGFSRGAAPAGGGVARRPRGA